MGAVLADLNASHAADHSTPEALLRMAAADPGRGECEYLRSPLGWLGIQRFADEAFLVQAGNHFLAFHGFAAWSAQAPARYSQGPATAERVLDCLVTHGSAAFGWLNAEFAALYLDGDRKRVLASCHFSGTKLLHWRRDGARLLLASAPRQIHAGGPYQPVLDESVVAAWQPEERMPEGRSLFHDTHRVDPGHALALWHDGTQGWREARERVFVLPDVDAALWRLPLDELVDMVSVELDRATDRLVLGRPGLVQVSGGLDSSNVLASVLRNARRRGTASPRAISVTFPGLSCDEQMQVLELDRALHANVHFERYDARQFAESAMWVAEHIDYPPMGTTHFTVAMCRQLGVSRICVTTGIGGDEWFTFAPPRSLTAPWREWLRHAPDMAGWSRRTLRYCWRRDALLPWLRPAVPVLARMAPHWPRAQRLLASAVMNPVEGRLRHCAAVTWRFALEQALASASIESISPLHWGDLVRLLARIPPLRLCASGHDKGLLHVLARSAISPAFAAVAGKVIFDEVNAPQLGRGAQGWLMRYYAPGGSPRPPQLDAGARGV